MTNSKETASCQCHSSSGISSSVYESLDELDFRRSLCSSAQENDLNEVRKRLTSQKNSIDRADSSGYTALHYSVRFQPAEVCRILLENGADPNRRTRASGSTALHRAILFRNVEAIRLLLEHKADPTIEDVDGQTAIDKARLSNDRSIVELFDSFRFER